MLKGKRLNILKKLGANIQSKRKSLGLTQEKLAELTDLHRTYIGMVERGEKNISINNLKKISEALHISLSELLKGI